MRRILVIGSSGSGKSTLAAALASRLRLPLVHLDQQYFTAGWVEMPAEAWTERVRALIGGDAWVIDGSYGGTLDLRLERCDAVVFLDLSRAVCLWRVFARWTRYRGRTRPDVAPECHERLTWEFLVWVWTFRARRRPEILARLSALPAGKRVAILRSPAEVRRFLDDPEGREGLGAPSRPEV